jgi:hypothetical protein
MLVLVGELGWLAQLSLLPRFLPSGTGAVRIARISIYGSMQFKRCKPTSQPAVSFPATSWRIYDLETFTAWRGKQRVRVEYDSPGGRVYAVSDFLGRDQAPACGYLSIYGQDAAAKPGWWRIIVWIGEHMLKSKSFKIHRIQPDPQSLIPPLLCRHGCAATLRHPGASQLRKNFNARPALIAFLRRYPDLRIVAIVDHKL